MEQPDFPLTGIEALSIELLLDAHDRCVSNGLTPKRAASLMLSVCTALLVQQYGRDAANEVAGALARFTEGPR